MSKDIFWKLIRYILVPDKGDEQGYTEGQIFDHNNDDVCDSLEDVIRDINADGDLLDEGEEKIYGRTAIPYGTYELIVTHSPTFKKKMVLIKDVKHFEGVRMHGGTNVDHTLGCVLCGKKTKPGRLKNTGMTEILVEKVEKLTDQGHRVFLVIESPN